VDQDELWQHALFFAMSPEERCRFSLKTARSALSLRRSTRRMPILERTLRLAKRIQKRRANTREPVPGRKKLRASPRRRR
jgi:hypothetical protein